MHFPVFQDMLLLLGFSVIIVFLLQRLRLPSILGFLITGMLIGPHGLSLVQATEEVELLSEVGVIFLMFVIGMELSIKNLVTIRKTVFIGGSLQVGITILVGMVIFWLSGLKIGAAVFIGFLLSLSSTAIVLKILQDRNELSTPHGRNALGILIFQDIIVVPMMLFTPLLGGQGGSLVSAVSLLLLKIGGVAMIAYLGAKYVFPKALDAVARTNNKELFLLTTLALCFLVAYLTSEAGLSLALGAFLAGLIISESDYQHQATSTILPFRELFISFFFISIGMLLDLDFFFNHLGVIIFVVILVFLIKSAITAIAVAVLKYPPRTYLLTGLTLFQIGEFSFILSKTGVKYGLLSEIMNQYFLAVSIISMLMTPFVMIFSERMTYRFIRLRLIKLFLRKIKNPLGILDDPRRKLPYQNHLIIIGYGMNGHLLTQAAQHTKIPFIVIDFNAEIVMKEKKKGIPIIFGDATQEHILESAHLSAAQVVVVATGDLRATRTIISNIRSLSPSIHILVRTHYAKDMKELLALGANDVILEEFEASIQIFSQVLNNYLIPENEVDSFIEILRNDNYHLFQRRTQRPKNLLSAQLPDFNIITLKVSRDSGKVIGKSLDEIDLRKNYKINILGIFRDNKMLDGVHPEDILCFNDIIYVHGKPEHINQFQTLIS